MTETVRGCTTLLSNKCKKIESSLNYVNVRCGLQALADEAALDTGYDLEEEDDALRAAKTPTDLLLDSSTKARIFFPYHSCNLDFSNVMHGHETCVYDRAPSEAI